MPQFKNLGQLTQMCYFIVCDSSSIHVCHKKKKKVTTVVGVTSEPFLYEFPSYGDHFFII